MNLKTSNLHKLIHHILLYEWDPIGVKNIDSAHDEYDPYISQVYKMIIEKKTEQEIFDYLLWVERDYMGLTPDIESIKNVSKRIHSLTKE